MVDSDAVSVMILKHFFYLAGIHPEWVRLVSGAEAITYLKHNEIPDLIFLEPVLSDMQEHEILQQFKENKIFARTRVCLLTILMKFQMDEIGAGYTFFKQFIKPIKKTYIDELSKLLEFG